MSAIAINAADLAAPTSAFVAVRTTQINVSASATGTGKDFSSMFNSKEESVQIQPETKVTEKATGNKQPNTVEDVTGDTGGKVSTDTPQDVSEETEVVKATDETQETASATDEAALTTDKAATGGEMVLKASLKVSVTTVSMLGGTPAVDEEEMRDMMDSINTTAMEAIASLLQRFAEILDVTVDELEGSYEQLDFSFEDMIDVQKLPQLMLNLEKCEDLSQVLCEEAPAQIYTDLKEALNEMFETVKLTAEELTGLVTQEMFANKAAELEILPKGFVKLITGNEENTDEVIKTGSNETKQDIPEFTVTRESETNNFEGSKNEENTDLTSELKTSQDTRNTETKKTETNDGFEEFIKGLENAVRISDTKEIPMIDGKPDVREIVMRVVDAIKVNLSPDKTSIELSLSPQSLGKISLTITSKDGTLTARIATENEVTKQAIESQLEVLKETITQQGVRVEAIEVSVSGFTFADSNNAQKGETENDEKKTGAAGRKQVRDGEAGTSVAESAPATEITPEGSTVNFVA
ncbi:MAG: flagellar hook-length control protein FliK [Lachnospiraceae bacterium]|nr:flagellar hook-length control protein FliK [Lachnospiraceae bacterium]